MQIVNFSKKEFVFKQTQKNADFFIVKSGTF